jgi:type IV secretion system protein VirB6
VRQQVIRSFVFLLVVTLLPWAAAAQTASVLPLIAQDESSDNPTAQNPDPNSTASGLFGMTNATWAEALQLCGCSSVSEFGSAYEAPANVQIAAADALINNNGLSDWLCSGCDAAFTTQVAADGGVGAFQTSGLDTNPADFTSANTQAGLTAYLSGASTGTATVNTGDIAVTCDNCGIAAGAAGATATQGTTFNPFTYLWNQYQGAIAGPLSNELGTVQSMIQAPLVAFLSLSVMMMAIGNWLGWQLLDAFFNRMVRIAVVVGATGIGSGLYNQYVVQLFNGLPTWFSQNILGSTSANPAAGFDVVMHNMAAMTANTWYGLPWGVSTLFFDGPIIAVCFLIVFVAIGLMFTVWIIAQALLQLLIVLGPLIILSLLFNATAGWFHRWVSAMMLMVFVTLAADMITSIVLGVITGAMNTLQVSGTAAQSTQNVFNIVGIALVVFVLSSAVAILPTVLQHIASASGVPVMDRASRWFGGAASAAGRATGTAVRAAARLTG